MAKSKQKLSKYKNKRNYLFVSLLILIVLVVLGYSRTIRRYDDAYTLANIAVTRDLVIKSINNIKAPAPVDAKTGNIYFPQAGLYVPAATDTSLQRLLYSYTTAEKNSPADFSISNEMTLYAISSKAYTAQSIEELFDQIPHIQSCARGVSVSYKKLIKDETQGSLKASVHLNNGKTAYLYLEDACSELNDTVTYLKKLQSY